MRFCLRIWWRRSWFSLNGKMGIRGQRRSKPPTVARPAVLLARSVHQRRLRSRADQRRATEVDVAVHALNRMLELGRPESARIA